MRTREPRGADAGADRVDSVGVRDHGDLRAVARSRGDVGDLHPGRRRSPGTSSSNRLLDQLGVAPRDDDRWTLGRRRDLLDHGLDALRVVVALALDLLGLGQQRLDAFAQLHERVARVRLLHDACDQLADAGRGTPRTSCRASASRMRCRITCLAVCAAIRPKSSGGDVAFVDLVAIFGELGGGRFPVPRVRASPPVSGSTVVFLVDRLGRSGVPPGVRG